MDSSSVSIVARRQHFVNLFDGEWKLEVDNFFVRATNHERTPQVKLTGLTVPQEQSMAFTKRTNLNPS